MKAHHITRTSPTSTIQPPHCTQHPLHQQPPPPPPTLNHQHQHQPDTFPPNTCLLYTSDAADDM
eukprot:2542412-Alexandrium_andersonii.AAC.1